VSIEEIKWTTGKIVTVVVSTIIPTAVIIVIIGIVAFITVWQIKGRDGVPD